MIDLNSLSKEELIKLVTQKKNSFELLRIWQRNASAPI